VTKGTRHVASVVDHAYARWLVTQGVRSPRWKEAGGGDGWLIGVSGLHARRAPGNTCLAAMCAARPGSVAQPLNDSKGCGGVMRAAPTGLLARRHGGDPFELGRDIAALTHGHPSGHLPAGALAALVAALCADDPLNAALDGVEQRLAQEPGHEETLTALRAARALARTGGEPSPEAVAQLGEGWVGEEALAIAVYCALGARDFAHGVKLAVNHSGDSDSTGAITGNILGTLLGRAAIPAHWLDRLELRAEIARLCEDMSAVYGPDVAPDADGWPARYPGW